MDNKNDNRRKFEIKKDKLEKVYTKVIYIYKQKEDEMLPSEKKIFKEFIEKIDNLKIKALKAKDNKDAEVFFDLFLPDVVAPAARTQRDFGRVVGTKFFDLYDTFHVKRS